MLVVTVKVERAHEKDSGLATFGVEREAGGSWRTTESQEVDPGATGEERKFLLETEERLVIRGASDMEVHWDKENNAAIPVPKDPVKKEEFFIEKARIKEENVAKQNEAQEKARELAEERQKNQKKTSIGRAVEESPPAVLWAEPVAVSEPKPAPKPSSKK